ncbi:PIN domain-containing protein [Pseudokineococcus sp. 1T1Z-3]|uniref:PIN domain-containing protein n=1 Tax=Pseudokineococcus sp. 1T1Z-3 TaxID=3132745 RepID=UPI0030AA20B6
MYTAVLDTCVLWPSLQRDFLLSLAAEGLYRPVWSSAVLDELWETENAKHLDRGGGSADDAGRRADHLIDQMRTAFVDADVDGWQRLEGVFGLPDAADEHLLAVAVVSGAEAVVTENVRDLPPRLVPEPVQVLRVGDFAFNTVAVSPRRARAAVSQIASRFGRHGPRRTEAEIGASLRRLYGMGDAMDLLGL